MSASIWQPASETLLISPLGSVREQEFEVLSPLQSVFNLTQFNYLPGAGALSVYINGVRQRSTDFEETSSSSFTILQHIFEVGDSVTAVAIVNISQVTAPAPASASASTTTFEATAAIPATNVQHAIEDVQTSLAAAILSAEATAASDLATEVAVLTTALATKANAASVPAQVNLTSGAGIAISGSYPNLQIANTQSASGSGLVEEVVVLGNPTVGSGVDRWQKTHSLGVIPKIIVVEAECLSPINGYAVGDVVEITALGNTTTLYPICWRKSSSSVTPLYVGFGFVTSSTDGSKYFVLGSNWSVRYRLFA